MLLFSRLTLTFTGLGKLENIQRKFTSDVVMDLFSLTSHIIVTVKRKAFHSRQRPHRGFCVFNVFWNTVGVRYSCACCLIHISVNVYILRAVVLLASAVILYWIKFLIRHYEPATPKVKVFGSHVPRQKFVTNSRDIVIVIYQATLLLVLLVRNRITERTCHA